MDATLARETILTPAYKRDHYEVDLEEVAVSKPDEVCIAGDTYALTKTGTKSLCKLLEVPTKFYEEINTADPVLWDAIVSRLKELKNVQVRFAVGKGDEGTFISSFNKTNLGWVDNSTFIDMVETVLVQHPTLALKSFFTGKMGMAAQIIDTSKDVAVAHDLKDLYRLSYTLTNSEELFERTHLSHSIERLVCTNGAVMREKEGMFTIPNNQVSQNIVADFYEKMRLLVSRNITLERFIREKIDVMVNTPASLREMNMAWNIIDRVADKLSDRIGDIDKRIPIKHIASKYAIEFPIQKSEQWMSTARTPMPLYDLFNEVTKIASTEQIVSDQERLAMQIEVGKTFFKKVPDFKDVAPLIVSWN